MGCGASRIEESPLVTLCRSRKNSIRAAANRRFAVAEYHQKYAISLSEIGDTIYRFIHAVVVSRPAIVLPPDSKSSDGSGSGTSLSHDLSSDSVSEPIVKNLANSSDENSSLSEPLKKNLANSPDENYGLGYLSKLNSEVPDMVYENPPIVWDFFSGYNYENDNVRGSVPKFVSSSPPPPPPPPPPSDGSAWDFFNPFVSFENYVPNYYGMGFEKSGSSSKSSNSSGNLSEVRRREGIPELEEVEEDANLNTVKEDSKNNDFGEGTSSAMAHNLNDMENKVELEEDRKGEEVILEEDSSVMLETNGSSDVSKVVDIKTKGFFDVAKEIKEYFELGMACAEEVLRMLEGGKVEYKPKHRIYQAFSSRFLQHISLPMLSSASRFKVSKYFAKRKPRNNRNSVSSRNCVGMKSGNLSLTLEKLYVWERKLYKEIKVVILG